MMKGMGKVLIDRNRGEELRTPILIRELDDDVAILYK